MLGYVRLCYILLHLGYIRQGCVGLCYIGSFNGRLGYVRLVCVGLSFVKLCHVRLC